MTVLHVAGDFLRELLLAVPLSVARCCFVALPVAVLIWVLCLPRDRTTPEAVGNRWDENLKLGSSIALIAQILIYSFL